MKAIIFLNLNIITMSNKKDKSNKDLTPDKLKELR